MKNEKPVKVRVISRTHIPAERVNSKEKQSKGDNHGIKGKEP